MKAPVEHMFGSHEWCDEEWCWVVQVEETKLDIAEKLLEHSNNEVESITANTVSRIVSL